MKRRQETVGKRCKTQYRRVEGGGEDMREGYGEEKE